MLAEAPGNLTCAFTSAVTFCASKIGVRLLAVSVRVEMPMPLRVMVLAWPLAVHDAGT